MTPSEVRKLTPGTVLATKPFLGTSTRVVVASVKPRGKRGMDVIGEDGHTYFDDDLLIPTQAILDRWAEKARQLAEEQALAAEMTMVKEVLGVTPVETYAGYGRRPVTYTVTLTREAAMALVKLVKYSQGDR